MVDPPKYIQMLWIWMKWIYMIMYFACDIVEVCIFIEQNNDSWTIQRWQWNTPENKEYPQQLNTQE